MRAYRILGRWCCKEGARERLGAKDAGCFLDFWYGLNGLVISRARASSDSAWKDLLEALRRCYVLDGFKVLNLLGLDLLASVWKNIP
jgi:hypothetical protein